MADSSEGDEWHDEPALSPRPRLELVTIEADSEATRDPTDGLQQVGDDAYLYTHHHRYPDDDSASSDDKLSLLTPSTFHHNSGKLTQRLRNASRWVARLGGALQIVCGFGTGIVAIAGGLNGSPMYFSLLIAAASFTASGLLQILQVGYDRKSFVKALHIITSSLSFSAALGIGLLATALTTMLYGYMEGELSYNDLVNQSPYIGDGVQELTAAPVLFIISIVEFIILTTQLCFDMRCAV